MTQKIDVTLNVNEARAVSAWLRYRRSIEAVNQEMNQTGRISDRNKRKAQDHLATVKKMGVEALSSFTGIGSAIAGIASAAALINQHHETLIRRQKERSVAAQDFGKVMRDVRVAFRGDETVSDKELETKIREIAARTRTDPNIVGTALIDTFSAKGDSPNQPALEAQEAAFRLKLGDLESGRALAARALDLKNAFGMDNMEANVGFMQNIQNVARLTDLAAVGSNMLPGIISVAQQGDSPEQSAELAVTLSRLMVDAEGRQSSTAVIAIAQQLQKFAPTEKGSDSKGEFKVPADQIAAFAKATNTTERVAVMQQSPELLRQFLSGASFEKKAQTSVERLLSGEAVAMGQYRSTQEQIAPLDLKQVDTFNEKIASIEAGEFQPGVRAIEQAKANTVEFQLNNKPDQIKGTAQEIFDETMSQVATGMERFIHAAATRSIDNIWMNDIESQIRTLENIKLGRKIDVDYGNRFGKSEEPAYVKAQKELDYLNRTIDLLKIENERLKGESPAQAPSKPGFWERVFNSPTVKRFTGENQGPIPKSEIRFDSGNKSTDGAPEPYSRFGDFAVQPGSTASLTQALKENTEAIKSQASKPADAKQPPVKVEVTVSSDTATAPNGPRPSASLARPLK